MSSPEIVAARAGWPPPPDLRSRGTSHEDRRHDRESGNGKPAFLLTMTVVSVTFQYSSGGTENFTGLPELSRPE